VTGDRPVVAVLGAAGYLGSAVVDALAGLPVRLRVVSRTTGRFPAGCEVVRADLAEPEEVRAAVGGADGIVQLAAHIGGAQSWRSADARSRRINVDLMRDIVDNAERRPVVVFAGTVQAYGGGPANDYVRQKTEAERLLLEATSAGLVRGVVLRLTTLYGHSPRSGSVGRGVIAAMARRALAGDALTMWHDGTVERDLLHVIDAARAFVTALDGPEPLAGHTWAVGSDRQRRLGDVFAPLAAVVADRTGRPPVPIVSRQPPDYADANDLHSLAVDCSAFPARTGWRPRVGLDEGLAGVVDAIMAEDASAVGLR